MASKDFSPSAISTFTTRVQKYFRHCFHCSREDDEYQKLTSALGSLFNSITPAGNQAVVAFDPNVILEAVALGRKQLVTSKHVQATSQQKQLWWIPNSTNANSAPNPESLTFSPSDSSDPASIYNTSKVGRSPNSPFVSDLRMKLKARIRTHVGYPASGADENSNQLLIIDCSKLTPGKLPIIAYQHLWMLCVSKEDHAFDSSDGKPQESLNGWGLPIDFHYFVHLVADRIDSVRSSTAAKKAAVKQQLLHEMNHSGLDNRNVSSESNSEATGTNLMKSHTPRQPLGTSAPAAVLVATESTHSSISDAPPPSRNTTKKRRRSPKSSASEESDSQSDESALHESNSKSQRRDSDATRRAASAASNQNGTIQKHKSRSSALASSSSASDSNSESASDSESDGSDAAARLHQRKKAKKLKQEAKKLKQEAKKLKQEAKRQSERRKLQKKDSESKEPQPATTSEDADDPSVDSEDEPEVQQHVVASDAADDHSHDAKASKKRTKRTKNARSKPKESESHIESSSNSDVRHRRKKSSKRSNQKRGGEDDSDEDDNADEELEENEQEQQQQQQQQQQEEQQEEEQQEGEQQEEEQQGKISRLEESHEDMEDE